MTDTPDSGQAMTPDALKTLLAGMEARLGVVENEVAALKKAQAPAAKPARSFRSLAVSGGSHTVTPTYVDDGKEIGLATESDTAKSAGTAAVATPANLPPAITIFSKFKEVQEAHQKAGRDLTMTAPADGQDFYTFTSDALISRRDVLGMMGMSAEDAQQFAQLSGDKKSFRVPAAKLEHAVANPVKSAVKAK